MEDEEQFDGFEDEVFEQDGPGLFDDGPVDDAVVASGTGERQAAAASARPAPLALYRRYRPDTFADVIGQEHVTEPLQRALLNNRVNHAYLFSGPRGCGKTTSARILARCLNCAEGPTPTPCGTCQSCRDLATGGPGSIDVIEIDAASHGGVDDARDLRERAFFAPVASRYKIYIVDEAHMVTSAGFNALLKLVEEPPPHVKFIFATTEPEKVIGTIRSRTHHYPFRLVPPKVLGAYLTKICGEEGVEIEPSVIPLVVRAGAGSVRDSLSVLDQLLGGAGESGVTYGQATGLLGFTPDSLLDEICDAFAAGDGEGVFASVDKVVEVGQDPRRFAEDLLRRLRDLVVVAAVPDAVSTGLVDVAGDQGERLATQAAGMGIGELTRAAGVIAQGLTEMRGTTAPRLHLELMCARVLLPGADVDERGIHARLERLERRLGMVEAGTVTAPAQAQSSRPQPAPPGDTGSAVRDRAADSTDAHDATTTQPGGRRPAAGQRPTGEPSAERRPAGRATEPEPAQSDAVEQSAPEPAAAAPEAGGALTTADLRRLWPRVMDEVKARRRFTWIMLSQHVQVHDVHGRVLTLSFANAGARDSWGRGGNEDILREAIVETLGHDLKIETIVDGAAPPAAGAPRPAQQPPRPRGDEERGAAGQRQATGQSRSDAPHERPAPSQEPPTSDPSSGSKRPAASVADAPRPPAQAREGLAPERADVMSTGTQAASTGEDGQHQLQAAAQDNADVEAQREQLREEAPDRAESTRKQAAAEQLESGPTQRRRPAGSAGQAPSGAAPRRRPVSVPRPEAVEPPPDEEPPPEEEFDPYGNDADVASRSSDELLRETLGASRIVDQEP